MYVVDLLKKKVQLPRLIAERAINIKYYRLVIDGQCFGQTNQNVLFAC